MEEEIRSLIGMGTWELVERPRGVNIMKNQWVLTTKYCLDGTIEHEKARLVMKGFTQVCGADYDKTYSPSKLDRVLYMNQPGYFDDGTGQKKSLFDEALYFKASDNGVTCWVLVYVYNLLAASSSPVILKELKQLLEDAFEQREISPAVKYLGLEIVRDKPARKLWLHQQGYVDKLCKRCIDEEHSGRVPKTPVSVDAYGELTFDDEEAQEHEEEEYRQKVGSLQFAATTTRPDIAVRHGKFVLKYIPTTEQPGDFLTKALHFPAFNRCSVAIGQMYESSNRPSTMGELLDRLHRAAGDRCGVADNQGARQVQLSGLDDEWAVDQEGQFDREVDGAVRRPET
ncbi:unnamed protein product [Closterium sp. NIES-53]